MNFEIIRMKKLMKKKKFSPIVRIKNNKKQLIKIKNKVLNRVVTVIKKVVRVIKKVVRVIKKIVRVFNKVVRVIKKVIKKKIVYYLKNILKKLFILDFEYI